MRGRGMSVVLVVGVAMVAGCGSSSTASSTSSSAATKAPSATATSKASTGAPSFASGSNCLQLGGLGAKFARAMAAARSGGQLNLQAAVSAYHDLANAAPSDIRPDLQLTAQAFTAFAGSLTKVGYTPGKTPTPAQLAGLQSAVQIFTQTKFQAAERHLSVWAHQHCK
jgi:hypothetical protein